MTHDIGKEQPHSTISAKISKNEHASVVTGDANTDVVNSTTSELQTILAILKGNIGSGCLALPWAFSILGIPLGCLITFILTFLVGYNSWSLVLLKRKVWGWQRGITYSDVGERAFGKDFRVVVDVSVILLQMAICTVYFSNIGENLSSVFRQTMNPPSYDDHGGSGGGGGSTADATSFFVDLLCDRRTVMILFFPPILWLALLPNLKSLAPSVALATILMTLTFVLIGLVVVVNWTDGLAEWRDNHTTLQDFIAEIDWGFVPMATCAIMFSLEGTQLILPLESSMTHPERFKPVLIKSMITISCVFCVFSSLCVVAFGDVDDGSITAFLLGDRSELAHADGGDGTFASYCSSSQILLLTNVIASLSLVFTYPLQLFPAIDLACQIVAAKGKVDARSSEVNNSQEAMPLTSAMDMDASYDAASDCTISKKGEITKENHAREGNINNSMLREGDSIGLRSSLVITTFVVAIIVPQLQTLTALAGAVAGATTSLVLPPLLALQMTLLDRQSAIRSNTKILSSSESMWMCGMGQFFSQTVFYSSLLVVGCIYASLGTVYSIIDIISQYKS